MEVEEVVDAVAVKDGLLRNAESESLTGLLDLEIVLHGKFAHRTGVRVTANRSPRYHPAYYLRIGYQLPWSSRWFPLKGAEGR